MEYDCVCDMAVYKGLASFVKQF